jgi:hypothetical protein
MPALIIIIDEYAELAEQAPDAMDDTDSIARLGTRPGCHARSCDTAANTESHGARCRPIANGHADMLPRP